MYHRSQPQDHAKALTEHGEKHEKRLTYFTFTYRYILTRLCKTFTKLTSFSFFELSNQGNNQRLQSKYVFNVYSGNKRLQCYFFLQFMCTPVFSLSLSVWKGHLLWPSITSKCFNVEPMFLKYKMCSSCVTRALLRRQTPMRVILPRLKVSFRIAVIQLSRIGRYGKERLLLRTRLGRKQPPTFSCPVIENEKPRFL